MALLNKEELIEISKETFAKVSDYTGQAKAQKITYSPTDLVEGIVSCSSRPSLVEVVKMDTLDAVCHFQELRGKRYTFLVLASNSTERFGAQRLSGCRGQEESIARRTDLVSALRSLTPPVPEYGGIFCQGVTLLRDNEEHRFRWFRPDEQVISNCFLASAIPKPKVDPESGQLSIEDAQRTKVKLRSIFSSLAMLEERNLILGAYGCGIYQNPAKEMAQMMSDLLTNEYQGSFDHVVFAIIDNKGTKNFETFEGVFRR